MKRLSTEQQLTDFYEQMQANFGWNVPEKFNIAEMCARRWSHCSNAQERIAVIEHSAESVQGHRYYSYAQLQQQADALSRTLKNCGVRPGDRVAIVLPQRFETAVAYISVLQMGAVAMPLSQLFGPDALEYRLQNSESVLAIVDSATAPNLLGVRAQCPHLKTVIGIDTGDLWGIDVDYHQAIQTYSGQFDWVQTSPQDAAVLIYTSGTTGAPKGALIPHEALIGNLTGFVCSQNWFGFHPTKPQKFNSQNLSLPAEPDVASVFWSPADWAWTGGLMDALLPTLYFGRPIVAYNGRFSAQLAFELMQAHRVTHTFLFPTALKSMMKAYQHPSTQFKLHLQAIMSAGEAVGDAVFEYCEQELGVIVNEMFGQTEINYIVGNCAMNHGALWGSLQGVGWPAKPGSMGRGYPGHRVAVIDENGNECPAGVVGDVALHRFNLHGQADPIFFLGYWKNDQATAEKFIGDWCRTGDLALCDEDGYLWYQGRADDVFKSAGYRIGPSEIENCLVKHASVANAAVVPKPDSQRGALVKAYVVLAPGFQASEELVAQLQAHVRGQLAPYEYPKEIEFIAELPMTTTGKVQRRILRLQEEQRAQKLTSSK
jgi:acetyl-CoA synthetase